jgi:leucyl aminopeptidase
MKIVFTSAPPASAQGLVRLVGEGALPEGLAAEVSAGAKASRFTGKAGQVFEAFARAEEHGGDDDVIRQVFVGTGDAKAADRTAALEKAGGALTARYLTSGVRELALDLAGTALSASDVAAFLLGARLRGWSYDYRTKRPDDQKVSFETIRVMNAPQGAEAAWSVEAALAEGLDLTRELVTEPANIIYPETFVERVKARLEGSGVTVEVVDEKAMKDLGMGALLGVAQGSVRPPRLMVMRWNGGGSAQPTAFVGKGVTFDTGGISLKPPAGMEDMKWDMGGAGAVAGTMLALARRKAECHVVGICGLVENMPDGNAQRPGDVVTTMDGQTVEVINTDAEGRLVLCDAITWTQENIKPVQIVDLATLTGAMIISLGHEHGGLFSNDDALADKLVAAGKASGDKLWRFPLSPAYDKLIDSPIADMKNVGPREGGSITAAQFIQRFVKKGTPWAHLDIAGMVWASKPGATWDKGATGFGVRVLDRFVRDNLEA